MLNMGSEVGSSNKGEEENSKDTGHMVCFAGRYGCLKAS